MHGTQLSARRRLLATKFSDVLILIGFMLIALVTQINGV